MSDSSLVFQATGIGQTVTVGVSQTISDGDQSYADPEVTSDARYRYVDPPDVSVRNLDLTPIKAATTFLVGLREIRDDETS